MRTLAIDFGTRRVGLALSDDGGRFATPFDVLTISSPEQATQEITRLIQKEQVQRLLVGVPLNMDDTIGPAAKKTIAWARAISESTAKPLVLVDERLSSFEAEQSLIDRKRGGEKMTQKDKKTRLDAIAAASFLQAYLDGRLPVLKFE